MTDIQLNLRLGDRWPLPPENKFHNGNGEDGKHYWLTPPDLYAQNGTDAPHIVKCETCKGKGSVPVFIEHTALGDLFVKQIYVGDETCIDCGGTGKNRG